jgi:hypothetical protein
VPTDVLHHDLMLLMNNKLVATDAVEVGKMVLHITDAGRAALAACEVESGQKLSTPTDNVG